MLHMLPNGVPIAAQGGEAMSEQPVIVQMQRETHSSIELTRGQRQSYSWVIKLYHEEGDEDSALQTLQHIDARLREMFIPAAEQKETEE